MMPDPLYELLGRVYAERQAQLAKWGRQSHPNGTSEALGYLATAAKHRCDRAVREGNLTWLDILMEEVYEASEATEPGHLSEELIQVAAVCLAWVEDIATHG